MSLLIENGLAGDRLAAGEAPFEKAEIFDLNETLHAAKAGLDEDAGRRVNFIHGDKAMVKGARILLEIAVQNLIQNALKYTGTTNSVTEPRSTNHDTANVRVNAAGLDVYRVPIALYFVETNHLLA